MKKVNQTFSKNKNQTKSFEKKNTLKNDLPFNSKNFFEKILQIKRVTKVVKGGKRLSFRAVLVIGDKRKKIGVGVGKGNNVALAIDKAKISAKKNLIYVPLTRKKSVPHLTLSSFCGSTIMLSPASPGTGVIAGSSVRAVLELSGFQNILSKELGSNNILNNALATIKALQHINTEIWCSKNLSKNKKKFYQSLFKQ